MLLEVSHLRKTFGDFVAVDDLSLHVDAGEIFGLVGPNGAGKTTTIRMLCGLLTPAGGSIRIDGRPFNAADWKDRAQLGVVPQELAIYPDLTAMENLKFFCRLYGVHGDEMKHRIGFVLSATALADHAHSIVKTFSGGMKRRLNFGVALVHQPRLLILDEPTVGVDPQSRSHLLDCVSRLGPEVGVIYTSHYMEEVEAICHRIGIMDHGRLLACGTQRELLGNSLSLQLRVAPPVGSGSPHAGDLLNSLQRFGDVAPDNDGELALTLKTDCRSLLDAPLQQVLETIARGRGELRSITTEEGSLEGLFLKLTGRRLRD